ncbi:FKBP-type peptidyl-prolyl cis-trans isomerase [Rugamonas apoptosis]|uniref:Peptidyl-prolyl cis-trans isomerase n=1 Tax=Rugamonas apoptosis TaxID=2758570 RepID=A0A7W2F667_9BURK|nr:FKBP-type peptidyl-prolyl cis-trans isomerase [Rugamonas apoptosis]MBA5685822.1 FKBP-type peptidyl-prolyl cis-trans isomerase [Rugamonas apoptosis]
MKSMFQLIAAVAVGLTLTACGGGSSTPAATTPVVAQPAFQKADIVTGTGTEAANNDLLVISYTGWLYDASKSDFKGAKIDSSVDRNAPVAFTLGTGQWLAGLDQGILGMKVGGKRTLVLPASLAYGANSKTAAASVGSITYAAIPANAALVYDVELVSVTKASVPVFVAAPTVLKSVDTAVGTGDTAVAGKTLTVKYTGYLYDGSRPDYKGDVFDSSVIRNATFDFVLGAGKVIPGWDQGVPGMLVGGKRTLIIPPGLGYGSVAQAALPAVNGFNFVAIPANSTLVFDIELVSVK